MPVALKDAVYQVRSKVGELESYNWSDNQIVTDLNWAAREMCSIAGMLTRFQSLSLQSNVINQTYNIPAVSTAITLAYSSAQITITNQSATTTLYFSTYSPATTTSTSNVILPGATYTYSSAPISTFYVIGSAASGTFNVYAATGLQEAALDVEVDMVKSCKYFSGQLYDLEYHDWKSLQTGASTGSIPLYYYMKTDTHDLTPQSTNSSNIIDIPIGAANNPLGQAYRTVLGVWPIPPTPAQIEVWYSYIHPWMRDPTDMCEIPAMFMWGWCCGAIAKCLRIEKAIAEAQEYEAIFAQYCEKFRIYAGKQKQADRPARYGATNQDPWRRSASSSVILIDQFPRFGG